MVRAAAKTLASLLDLRPVVSEVRLLLVDLGVAAEERLLAWLAVHHPVAELVADREAAARPGH